MLFSFVLDLLRLSEAARALEAPEGFYEGHGCNNHSGKMKHYSIRLRAPLSLFVGVR